jgi:hypothetical protein
MEEEWRSLQYYVLNPLEKELYRVPALKPGKDSLYHTGLHITLSLAYLYWMYSILPRLKIFVSSPNAISIYVSPSPSKLGRQSCRAACL